MVEDEATSGRQGLGIGQRDVGVVIEVLKTMGRHPEGKQGGDKQSGDQEQVSAARSRHVSGGSFHVPVIPPRTMRADVGTSSDQPGCGGSSDQNRDIAVVAYSGHTVVQAVTDGILAGRNPGGNMHVVGAPTDVSGNWQ
jgi:hypothetical protein